MGFEKGSGKVVLTPFLTQNRRGKNKSAKPGSEPLR